MELKLALFTVSSHWSFSFNQDSELHMRSQINFYKVMLSYLTAAILDNVHLLPVV